MRPVVIIVPGNGCNNIRRSNWYGQLYNQLSEKGITCVCENFPDPFKARREKWVPFIENMVKEYTEKDDRVILVGHSSGAQATLRYAEDHPLHAAVLVSATYSDLGDQLERQSGYYPQRKGTDMQEENSYGFSKMKKNCKIWHQFHSDDDPFIPVHEAEAIQKGLGLTDTFHFLPGRSHFFEFQPELLQVVLSLC